MSIKPKVPKDIAFLVIEDMANVRLQMVNDLKSLGYNGTIYQAENIEIAEKYLNEMEIDYVLSDWILPDGVGIELLKKCRGSKELKSIPFLMVTSMDSISEMLQAIEAGASDYIVKPWDKKELEQKIVLGYQALKSGDKPS